VTRIDDVLNQLGPIDLPQPRDGSTSAPTAPTPNLSGVERQLWDAIAGNDVELETLLEQTGLRASEASAALLMMEMRKLIVRHPGNRYARRA
jgi:predicted Rossmann fold nucleotide-binding protein DprA/Smf involved in DNA uptake